MQKLRLRIVLGISIAVLAILIIVEIISVCSWSLCSSQNQNVATNSKNQISIVATIYPLAWMASDLDPSAIVTTIVGAGLEPHDFSPTINDVKSMQNADLLIVNGGVDEWAFDVVADRKNSTISVIKALDLASTEDPHVWLDPMLMQEIIEDIGARLENIDPSNAVAIRENVLKKVAILQGIDDEYRVGLSLCATPEIISSHDAFGFLAKRYGFTVYGIAGFSPENEPSPSKLVELTDLIRSHHITTVFFEELASDAFSKTLADETGIKIDVLDAIESLASKESERLEYPGIMEKNLAKLRSAMVCQQ